MVIISVLQITAFKQKKKKTQGLGYWGNYNCREIKNSDVPIS